MISPGGDRRAVDVASAHLRLLTCLQEATAALAGALTLEDAARAVARAGADTLGADWAGVALLERGRWRWVASSAAVLNELAGPGLPLGPAPVYVTDTTAVEQDELAWVIVPLLDAQGVMGALRYAFKEPRSLTTAERRFVEALGGQCALAVQRAQLIAREQAAGVTLQRALLPAALPNVPGLELAARYLPAVKDVSVGGDWYDALVLPDRRLSLSVGDVMGKGLVAAAGMGRMRSALRALAVNDPDPAGVLASLDRLFTATESGDHELLLTTLVLMVVDPVTGQTSAADAGHLPIVRVAADGSAALLDVGPGTTPLGLPQPRVAVDLALAPGETLLAFTDGLVKVRDRSLDDGLAAVIAAAAGASGASLEALLDAIVDARLGTDGGEDDVTLLGVRRREQPTVADR